RADTSRGWVDPKRTFGTCLGHQLLALALGAKTFKLKSGHRGATQPVLNRLSGRVEITTQNHGFAVSTDDLPAGLEPTHFNLNDGTLEGLRHRTKPLFCVQYHPEASAGPPDRGELFEQFRTLMAERTGAGADRADVWPVFVGWVESSRPTDKPRALPVGLEDSTHPTRRPRTPRQPFYDSFKKRCRCGDCSRDAHAPPSWSMWV